MSTKPETALARAIAGWQRCGLTPSQTRTELERFAANMESDRAKLVAEAQQAKAAITSIYLMCADQGFSNSPKLREFADKIKRELDPLVSDYRTLLLSLGES